MTVAGLETIATSDNYNKVAGHTKKRGFTSDLKIKIDQNGKVVIDTSNFYMLHGIVLSVTWGLLALI